MIRIYGSMLCKDCVQCCKELDEAKVPYEFLDFSEELGNLKTFLSIRDREPIFDSARKEGYIGIPCIVKEDGSVSLDWKEVMM